MIHDDCEYIDIVDVCDYGYTCFCTNKKANKKTNLDDGIVSVFIDEELDDCTNCKFYKKGNFEYIIEDICCPVCQSSDIKILSYEKNITADSIIHTTKIKLHCTDCTTITKFETTQDLMVLYDKVRSINGEN